mmetsp:Transcript_41883/g.110939  ORF Transcript_41883/g.110939 Transcript_41883/m.110939 type:complete len:382 (-) Transcript_41883:128-1273(-)
MAMGWKNVMVEGQNGAQVEFRVPEHLEFIKRLGSGAYGTVASFKDPLKGKKLAVKKITDAFHDVIDGKRILREIKLMRALSHENVIGILDMYPPDGTDFDDIYMVLELMETDLHRVIYSKQALNDQHNQYFTYQILRGLLYLHSANVIHRDLKPANILVNKSCDLKICDFGLARGFDDEAEEQEEASQLTDYVVTRWYRAPEVVLIPSKYTKSIDVWSVGCILCELIGRKPIFTGRDHRDQIKKILQVVGSPTDGELHWLPENGQAKTFISRMPPSEKREWKAIYPQASDDGVQAIESMLTFDPTRRVSVAEAIRLRYFENLHLPDDEPTAKEPVDWAFDKFEPTKRLLQNHIYVECSKFYPSILQRDEALLKSRGIDELL